MCRCWAAGGAGWGRSRSPVIPGPCRQDSGRVAVQLRKFSRAVPVAAAEPVHQGEETDGFPDAAQGDVVGVVLGVLEEAVEAELEEVEAVQGLGQVALVLQIAAMVQGPGQVAGVAVDRGGGKAEAGGDTAVGLALLEGLVDLGQGAVMADGAAGMLERHEGVPAFLFFL